MSYLTNKIGILKDVFMGNLMKLKTIYDICLRKSIDVSRQRDSTIIVSLTSYGKRVRGSVIYTIYSLLKQTVQPERIVLWLNEKEYSDENLPETLRFLCQYGLEVRYCRDIRSYTKMIHSISAFPDKHIITVDDDIYYTKEFIKEFSEAHQQHPQAIIAGIAKMPVAKADKQLAPYIDWPEYCHVPADFEYDKTKLMALGIGGVLYPCNTFDNEVLNESVFMALCPKADDIWLYIMGLRCQAEKRMLTESQISYYHTDLLRQYFTKDRLTAKNRLEGENDIQLQALLSHYNISL